MDGDHRVSFKDFQEAIKQENLLLQGFGQCLPDDKVKATVPNCACSLPCSLKSLFNTTSSMLSTAV